MRYLLAIGFVLLGGCSREPPERPIAQHRDPAPRIYPLHENITATVFWVGEPPSAGSPTNSQSAWDGQWERHFGGFDDPRHRNGWMPAAFVPLENPFYVALPYNDLAGGHPRADRERMIPWAGQRPWGSRESMCKNRWVRIVHGGRACFAQWEDVGPFRSDDAAYVFGAMPPANTRNQAAGIDVSPAVRDYLGLSGMDKVDWAFVDDADVPGGPWTRVVTRSQVSW